MRCAAAFRLPRTLLAVQRPDAHWRHSVADEHDIPGFDHEHGDIDWDLSQMEDIEGIETLTLTSVGIDIGSSTTHLVFSKLTLRREGGSFSARFRVADRAILYRSPIMLTPYLHGTRIDTDTVIEFVRQAYAEAGLTPENVDTGAVVITGEALKKENARPIAEFFAAESGKFICASAGHNMEAMLAAYGCGAVALSKSNSSTVLNIDIGGGTTKLSLIRDGVVLQTSAVSVGARLVAFDANGLVQRIEEPAATVARELGIHLALGEPLAETDQEAIAAKLTEVLFEVLGGGAYSPLTESLLLTDRLVLAPDLAEIDHVICSGGVSEYVYAHESRTFGDLGPRLGRMIRAGLVMADRPELLNEPAEGIRATVIGAGEYTVQASGTTTYVSDYTALPAFGLQVIRPVLEAAETVQEAMQGALAKVDLSSMIPGLAVALSLEGQQSYQSLRRIAEGIAAIAELADDGFPLYLVLNQDVARSLGGILHEELELPRHVVVLDGIDVGDLEYVDVGRPLGATQVMPVTVKSLLFPAAVAV